ncbi:MFS transporter [Ferrimonas gelatinilytica]|uniref:MFS transporter n=1 Tax=Ferrimonas gelatinilytica TaxID=1255257 RepID=A0ABP9SGT5_9GAMM
MQHAAVPVPRDRLIVPVLGLFLFAIAAGFLMSLLPLSLSGRGLSAELAAWLASAFYAGLLLGAMRIEPVVRVLGHRRALVAFLSLLAMTVVAMSLWSSAALWLGARLVAGAATAGIFVVVESWLLLVDDERQRARRLALYMTALYGGNALGQILITPVGVAGSLPFALVGLLLVLALLPPLLVRRGAPRLQVHHRLGLRAVKRLSRPAVLGCWVSGLLLGPLYGLLPLYLIQRPELAGQSGPMMALLIVGGMGVQPIAGALSARYSRTLLLALFNLMGMLGILVLLLAESVVGIGMALVLVGAAAFALYPVAIAQACQGQANSRIVSITELMLLCYSLGSVVGPLLAQWSTGSLTQLPLYLGIVFSATSIYMLVQAAAGTESAVMEPPAGLD